jgi:Cytochrome P460
MLPRIKPYLLLALSFLMILLIQGQTHPNKTPIHPNISLSEIRNYRSLIRVNDKPIDMEEATKFMCAYPGMIYGPHVSPGIVYYINKTAKKGAKKITENKTFPVGSLIIKEKQERKTEDSVQIITVMKKIRAGHGENTWDYKMYDVQKWSEVDASQQVHGSTCLECHRSYKDNDYISNIGISLLRGGKPLQWDGVFPKVKS